LFITSIEARENENVSEKGGKYNVWTEEEVTGGRGKFKNSSFTSCTAYHMLLGCENDGE
jgi:hypothetical protein